MMTTNADLEGFRAAQRLAYDCALAVARELAPEDTERDACKRMRDWLLARGVTEWFHMPFAWFGDRTAFRGFRTPLAFFPTARKLLPGMPFILDCGPVVNGYTADIGYSSALGENAIVDRLMDDLQEHRDLIADLVPRRPLGEVYDSVAALAARQGHTIRHSRYPFGVLGHRVLRAPTRLGGGLTLAGFGARGLVALGRERLALWNDRFSAGKLLPHGMWAVEPHLAFRDVGAKFEEILVVDDAGARWLDDDLPHVRRWARAA